MDIEQLLGERTLDLFLKKELESKIFSSGNIFWIKGEDRSVKITGAGDPLDTEQLLKFFKQGATLKIDRLVNLDNVAEAKIYFSGLKNAKSEDQRLNHRRNLIKWFCSIYWDGTRSGNLVDLMVLCTEVFYSFDSSLTNRFMSTSTTMFKRSGIISAMTIFIALIFGYTDYKFLKDLYNVTYLYDFAFDGDLSYNMNRASELERDQSGDGVTFLFLGENPGPELDSFVEHPRVSYEKAMDAFSGLFDDPGILRLIKLQHEKINGKGFPLSIKACDFTDVESIVIFTNHIIPYEDLEITPIDGINFLKTVLAEYEFADTNEALTARVSNLLVNEINNVTSQLAQEVNNVV